MTKILLALVFTCGPNLLAQFDFGNVSVRGEIHGGSPGLNSSLLVEAYNASSHLRMGQALVSAAGSFDLEPLPSGNYELRLVVTSGELVRSQFVTVQTNMPFVTFELPEPASHPALGSATVDVGQLAHRPNSAALHAFQKAVKAITRQDHQEAISFLEKAIQSDPGFAEAHLELSIQYALTDDKERSFEESQIAARLAPGNSLTRLNLAIVLFRRNQLPAAETEAHAAVRLNPANTKANFLTGAILVGEGKLTDETLAYLRRAYPDYPKAGNSAHGCSSTWRIDQSGTLRCMRMLLTCMVLFLPLAHAQRKVITPEEFARPGQPPPLFSAGILDGGTLYLAGQIGMDPKTGKISDDFETEVRTSLERIHLILKAANMDYSDLVSVQVFMTDMSMFQKMNAVYASLIKAPRPARATVGVAALAAKDAHIEISAIARK